LEAKKHYAFATCTGCINAFLFPYIGLLIFFELLVAGITGYSGFRALRAYIENPRVAITTMERLKIASLASSLLSLLSMGLVLQYMDPTEAFCWIFSTVFGIAWGVWYVYLRSAKRWVELFSEAEGTVAIV